MFILNVVLCMDIYYLIFPSVNALLSVLILGKLMFLCIFA